MEIDATEFISSNATILFPVIAILPYLKGGSNGSILFFNSEYFESFRNGIFTDNTPDIGYSENYVLECTWSVECLDNFTVQNRIFDTAYRIDITSPLSNAIKFYYYFTEAKGLIKIEKRISDPNALNEVLTIEEYFGI